VSAEQVVQHTINTYSEPNLAAEEIQSRWPSAKTLCASSTTSAVLHSNRCKTNSDRVRSAQSRSNFDFLGSLVLLEGDVCRRVSTRSTLIQHSWSTLCYPFRFQSPTRTPHLARSVPCLRVTGTEIPIGVRRHGVRTSCFTRVPSISFCSFR
jgi:hypothetical protein